MRIHSVTLALVVLVCAVLAVAATPSAPESAAIRAAIAQLNARGSSRDLNLAQQALRQARDQVKGYDSALVDYVTKPDDNFNWEFLPGMSEQGLGFTKHVLRVTSQRWLTDADVSRSIWSHFAVLFVPDGASPAPLMNGQAYIYITSGKNTDEAPPTLASKDSRYIYPTAVVQSVRCVTLTLFQIPNAPIQFWAEGGPSTAPNRTEDAIIAYTWKHFLDDERAGGPDPEWLLRLPMVKAVVAAMDASAAFVGEKYGSSSTLNKFIVSGASKRGWTTWLTGAVDKRVVAIVPIVLDLANFVDNMHGQFQSLGGWTYEVTDYVSLNLTGRFSEPKFTQLMQVEDPVNYFSVLNSIPKLVLSMGNDEFLMPDDVLHFWPKMGGEKHFRIFPNSGHGMDNKTAVAESIVQFVGKVHRRQSRPPYEWVILGDGKVGITCQDPLPKQVNLWVAPTVDGDARRDWRKTTCPGGCPDPNKPTAHPVPYTTMNEEILSMITTGKAVYMAKIPPPEEGGWVAFFLEVIWADGFTISSAPSILPQTYPFPDCQGQECQGQLV